MADLDTEKLSQLPQEMLSFTIAGANQRLAARLGTLAIRGRSPIQTPNYVANTSRGVVPHISQDNQRRHTKFGGLYLGLEDFIEKLPPRLPPIYELNPSNGDSPLRAFPSHPLETLTILGPRRIPAVETPTSNSNKALSICTSVGFRYLEVQEYITAGAELRPDVLIAPADILRDHKPSTKRAEKMSDRTAVWLRDTVAQKEACRENGLDITIFAPILPIAAELQTWYTNELVEDFRDQVSGLAFYDAHSLAHFHDSLSTLPRLALTEPSSPHRLLFEISYGADLFVLPFIGAATDGGVALDFTFPAPGSDGARHSLGVDTWDTAYATDLKPLKIGCQCYTCTKHHRAYLQHLLSAKEMLAWVLLQMHNHHTMDIFFAGVRASIANGTFEKDKEAFEKYYESELPENTKEGPRIRGYQMKSTGRGEPKKNPRGYNTLDDMAEALAEASAPSPNVDATELEGHGFGKVSEKNF